jgi:molybdopterin-guanine dinucleotide biosynthesis protein A
MRADTLGLILAGGLARRMGGGDKPLREAGGRPLLAHLIERLGPQVNGLVLNANGDPARFAAFGLPVVADSIGGFAGPLAGVLAGLDWAAEHRPDCPWVVSCPGDTPFPPADLVARLHAAREAAGVPLACASSAGHCHPPVGLWPVALREALRAALAAGERKIDRWTAAHGCAVAEWPDAPFDPFFNANTPQDVAEASRILQMAGNPGEIRPSEPGGVPP